MLIVPDYGDALTPSKEAETSRFSNQLSWYEKPFNLSAGLFLPKCFFTVIGFDGTTL